MSTKKAKKSSEPQKKYTKEIKPDHEKQYQSFTDDVLGVDGEKVLGEDEIDDYDLDDPVDRKGAKKDMQDGDGESKVSYMLFDFRRGPENWPKNCELVDLKRFDELLDKATAAAEMSAKSKSDGKKGEEDKAKETEVGVAEYGGTKGIQWAEEEKEDKRDSLHPEAQFETLRDGSTALVLQSGYRLKLWLNDIFDGGDANREARLKKEANEKKRMSKYATGFAGYGMDPWASTVGAGYGGKWSTKKYLNEYTITMDIKLLEDPPRDGIALFQTALIHSKENKRTGKVDISRSDGECIINQAGGVGILGTFGDTTKARVKTDYWKRVVVSVRNVADPNAKGEMKTWVGTEAGVVLKEDIFTCNDRFAIDPSTFYPFSSAQASMMPGKIAVRAIRVDLKAYNDDDVKANHARDKLISFFDEERQKEADEQRKGLSLAPLFPKPRPMWVAPSFAAVFGDAFIQNTSLEGSSLLAWSYEVVNYTFQQMINHTFVTNDFFKLPFDTRVAISDTLHIMQQSNMVFKLMMKLLKTPNESQLLSFLKKTKKIVQAIGVGNTLLFPVYIEKSELILVLERTNDRFFKMVVIQTNPYLGLSYHSPSLDGQQIKYRTALVLNGIPKKNCLDDVFWLAVYNMAIHQHVGDMDRFYDIVLPFLTGYPLESALVDAENAALKEPDNPVLFGELRLPQRSAIAYVRCILEAFVFLLRKRQVPSKQVDQIHLCFASELIHMMRNDMKYVLPNENGVRICELAVKGLSHLAVQVYDEMILQESKTVGDDDSNAAEVLKYIYNQVEEASEAISNCKADDSDLPPVLDLRGPENVDDPTDAAFVQFRNMLAWDVPFNEQDPGQQVALQKYVPVDFLQIPKKVLTRRDAIEAIRTCDRICTLIDNQKHCIKNDKFFICSLIENVFTQIVPVPKARGVGLSEKDIYRSEHTERRDKKRVEEKAKEAELKKAAASEKLKKNKNNKNSEVVAREEKIDSVSSTNIADDNKWHGFGEYVDVDASAGMEFEKMIVAAACIWDEPITYELQVELLLTLQRITEHFAAACLSIQQSRPFDAVCIIVTGCLTALADAIMRKIAIDEPSEACSHLMGKTKDGRQLGHSGFGISFGSFASQSDTLEIHYPELAIARTAVLDYFQSPQQRRLEKIFQWEEHFFLRPGRPLIKYLRNIAHEIALPVNRPHHWLMDDNPIMSDLFKNYPELKCYRDIAFWWKYFLNPDIKTFPNYVPFEDPREITRMSRMDCQLNFNWSEQEDGFQVSAFGKELRCHPDPKQTNPLTGKPIPLESLPTHRFASTATPSFYVPPPSIKTEDDVIYRPNLPTFEDQGGAVLNQRDSELLISYMTVPYLRLPLILTFFASEDRIHKLQSPELRLILDSVLFEPGRYLRMDCCKVEPTMVPSTNVDLLASPYGMLLNELCKSPDTVIRSIIILLKGALACDTGSVVDEGSTKFNTSTMIILYIARMGARVDNYLSFLVDYNTNKHDSVYWPIRDSEITPEILDSLKVGLQTVRGILMEQYASLFEDYLKRLDAEITKDPTNEKLIDRNSRLSCDLHSHKLLLYRNFHVADYTPTVAKNLLGSFVYLTTRHTWNKSTAEGKRLQMPETQIYELLQVSRRRMTTYLSCCRQGTLDDIMQTVLQVSSSLTGSFKASAAMLDNQNRWSRIQGARSCGRWAVGSTRTTIQSETTKDIVPGPAITRIPMPGKLVRQVSYNKTVGEVEDNGMLGVEIDVQLGQMTLRSKHLSALTSDVANHPDVNLIFGDATIQASLISTAENCEVYRLIGLNCTIEYWRTPHKICPPIDDSWDREYDPAELGETEKWIVSLFEPIRKNFFNGPNPPPMQFMLPAKQLSADAEVAIVLGLHQKIGGPFKLIYLFRRLRCLHIYEVVSQGREWWWSLHLTTDYRFTLREMEQNGEQRQSQFPDWWVKASGAPYPMGLNDFLTNDIDGRSSHPYLSVLIHRDEQHKDNLSGGRETFVPSRLLFGVVPAALLSSYNFWSDESVVPKSSRMEDVFQSSHNYKRLRGYPIEEDGEYIIIIEFIYTGNWADCAGKSSQSKRGEYVQCTGLPGRTVTIIKRPLALAKAEFKARSQIASRIESLKLMAAPKLSAKLLKEKQETAKKLESKALAMQIDDEVESDMLESGMFIPAIVRRVNDDGTFDVEFVGEYKWLGLKKNIDGENIQKRGEAERKNSGDGVWHWDNISEDEADDWRYGSDNEEDNEEEDASVKRNRLSFSLFDQLDLILEAANGDVNACLSALDDIAHPSSFSPFLEVKDLAKAVEDRTGDSLHSLVYQSAHENQRIKKADSEDFVMLNLLYAPRSSRLHSILKVLSRIETAGYIIAWTRAINCTKQLTPTVLEYGCPPIDLVELPRLKLSFVGRFDHLNEYRLYSVDHVDLFISNERNATYNKMLIGIPHSIILSNVRGEAQILVPVLPAIRPSIGDEPFSTFIVLSRDKLETLAERFFLYPVHISFSFLLTKGVNSALYLMLLRFLHRDYAEVFRLADSIATDTAFNKEGLSIFQNFDAVNNDFHPDAHACRLKISLVTIDAGMALPWELTLQSAYHILKLDSVSSFCRLSPREELQILESELIVTSPQSPKYNKEVHDEYSMAVVFNRLHYLTAQVHNLDRSKDMEVLCTIPARSVGTNWPYYQDNTIFGERYEGLKEVTSIEGESGAWKYEMMGGDEQDAPESGWLVVAVFHTLWSQNCIKVMPSIEELIPIYQDMINFISIKADSVALKDISKSSKVSTFPTILVLRGGREIERIVGAERLIDRLVHCFNINATSTDKAQRAKHRYRIRMEQAILQGTVFVPEEEPEKGEVDWTFDPEKCGENMKIEKDGMLAVLLETDDLDDEVKWEYSVDRNREWKPFDKQNQKDIEASYRSGKLYSDRYFRCSEGEFYPSAIKIADYEVTGFCGSRYPDHQRMNVRRWGDRFSVPGEEQFLTKEQKERDQRAAEWRERMAAQKKKLKDEKIGNDVECIRGTVGFLANTGTHIWSFVWTHEPARSGTCDSVGICSELREDFFAGKTPNLGSKDTGASIAFYADGSFYYNGNLLLKLPSVRKRVEKLSSCDIAGLTESDVTATSETNPETVDNSEKQSFQLVDSTVATTVQPPSVTKADNSTEKSKDAIDELPEISTGTLAPVFGKGSIIVLELDTISDGGTLTIYIDGEMIDSLKTSNLFEKLGGAELFPCISTCPIDPALVEARNIVQRKKIEKIEEEKLKMEEAKQPVPPPAELAKLVVLPGVDETELFDLAPSVLLYSGRFQWKIDIDLPGHSIKSLLPFEVGTKIKANFRCEGVFVSGIISKVSEHGDTYSIQYDDGRVEESVQSCLVCLETAETISPPSVDTNNTDQLPESDAIPKENIAETTEKEEQEEPLKNEIPIEKIRWMFLDPNKFWTFYSVDASRELEEAFREGKATHILSVGKVTHSVKLDRMKVNIDGNDTDVSIRKNILSDGLQGLWEQIVTMYEKPQGLSGAGAIKLFEKVWNSSEGYKGDMCGLGFLFLYNLLSGELRVKVIGSDYGSFGGFGGFGGYGGYGGGGYGGYGGFSFGGKSNSSSTDSHRYATLLAQLYYDRRQKSLPASVINVLVRNRQVSLRMPKFKDTRQQNQSKFFTGWTDEAERVSPVADLFQKIVPVMATLKRKGAFHFPPPPPHSELPPPPKVVQIPGNLHVAQGMQFIERMIPEIGDFGCENRVVQPVSNEEIARLINRTRFRLMTNQLTPRPPIHAEDTRHFQEIIKNNPDKLIILDFFATWCGPCKAFAPVFHLFSMKTPTAVFVKVDIDECDAVAAIFGVQSVPTIFIVRGGDAFSAKSVLTKIQGVEFVEQFPLLVQQFSSPDELASLREFLGDDVNTSDATFTEISASAMDVTVLSNKPLQECRQFIVDHSRKQLCLEEINSELAFDISSHESALTAPAKAVLKRFKDDVCAFSDSANKSSLGRISSLSDTDILAFFNGVPGAEVVIQQALTNVQALIERLNEIKDSDCRIINACIPMLEHAVNYVDIVSVENRVDKLRYLLDRRAGQNSLIWTEFLFGVLISTTGENDLRNLNPFLEYETIHSVLNLTAISMLRANRLGHTNRCIGSAISLEKMLTTVLKLSTDNRLKQGTIWIPKLTQLTEECSKTITTGRYYMTEVSKEGQYKFDPRYLVFEFVWNIQLRRKQVEIVNDFRENIASGRSKVKQMIMGAGKTSVVAPLLALIVADGKSLVLSVVPKALVEMSRTRMRETFAAIMVKRIYTLDFERSTVVKPSMSKSLENAAINRGVVVCTPTTLKSIMLSYVETLQHLKECHTSGLKSKLAEYSSQAEELQKILNLFNDGIMLLDEVDLILHPLKSELNFPIGEKFDLDGSNEGERWNLPIHLFDAFLYCSTGKISSFEQSGVALDLLKQMSSAIQQGIVERSLQRLPHIILLNNDFYHEQLKPIMANWTYLWLQKQHLHGIGPAETVRYLLEGAAAKSEASTKIFILEKAIAKKKMTRGEIAPVLASPTSGYEKAMSPEKRAAFTTKALTLKRQASERIASDPVLDKLIKAEEKYLNKALLSAVDHKNLVIEIYEIDEQIEALARDSGQSAGEIQAAIAALQKKIQEIECPRDDSLDNSIVLWCSQAFSAGEVGGSSTLSGGESSVSTICNIIEDKGFTIRRSSDIEETVQKARDLMQEGQLRCLLIGGDESGAGCGPSCVKKHSGKCLKCGILYESHRGHDCPSGGRGSWLVQNAGSASGAASMKNNMSLIKKLQDKESLWAQLHGALPADRVAVYVAHVPLSEDERMNYWQSDTAIFDNGKQLVSWVYSKESWKPEDDEDDHREEKFSGEVHNAKSETSAEKIDSEKLKIAILKADLEKLEHRKVTAGDSYDNSRKALHLKASDKHTQLSAFVQTSLTELSAAETEFTQLIASQMVAETNAMGTTNKKHSGPESGRDASYALAWLEVYHEDPSITSSATILGDLQKHHASIVSELNFLRRMELAAKVVSHVTSPYQKKLLNLSHNWLRTFLPHCLAKVNRVSFGLLSMEDCKAAIEADPMVPRSRLKLAVPFVGKDVPSKASEFAHPDIIIGLTILAYRYSGLRVDDYNDITDRLTAQFSNEIGPARDRVSSLRHEKWVWAAGGKIRGLKATRDGLPWVEHENLSDEQLSEKEVVQLKFLQKSNKEQMERLFNLIKLEPSVVHHYLQNMIFPQYMRSQREKISASGQAVGGDMLVMKRVGFSGTPSDLLPQELGRCDYETGDDGMMLLTCLDRSVTSYEHIKDQWNVEYILERIAKSESPRYHALIDTGALITGYSNYEVAKQLLDRGLSWCDGVVFLDSDDKQQVLVRATGRVVSAEQCGVSLEKRFAFYDQIHTTGMDIRHVVNATACITLGKDMVFRDFVQGAYRMRGIGIGQKIHVYIIPEVQETMNRELKDVVIPVPGREDIKADHVLEDIVAWLIINSLRSEQTQWTMLCIQNIGNLYRKNAFKALRNAAKGFIAGTYEEKSEALSTESSSSRSISLSLSLPEEAHATNAVEFIGLLDKRQSLEIFSESIDFSLESGVPDPMPFQDKLRSMLDSHEAFLLPDQHEIGHSIMEITGQFAMIEGSANRLDTEQEREQEQEQEKEVEQRRDQQVEIEKFVEREYSRQEEKQRPWPFKMLAQKMDLFKSDDHPFYSLSNFSLKHHDPLNFPKALYASSNFYNLKWTGLRRVKNVIMLLELALSTDADELRLRRPDEITTTLTEFQRSALLKAHNLFGFNAHATGRAGLLLRDDLKNVILAVTDEQPSDALLDTVIQRFHTTSTGQSESSSPYLTFEEFAEILTSGFLTPEHVGRQWVAVSLAEAETIRRILHVRKNKSSTLIDGATTECALHYLHMTAPAALPCGDGGVIFDASHKWSASSNRGNALTGATWFDAAVAHNTFRFFDSEMFYSNSSLSTLLKSLGGTTKDRESFFSSMIGVKRRMERKWQETPIAKLFTVPDQFTALRHQALAMFVLEALKARGLTTWEGFTAFDSDNNGLLSPAEFYGALLWLQVPDLTASDVVDYLEVVDHNRDGHIDYREYTNFLTIPGAKAATELDDAEADGTGDVEDLQSGERVHIKVEPHGADELRDIIVRRKQAEQLRVREDRLKKQAYNDALDTRIFEEELEASKLRKGGQNPAVRSAVTLSSSTAKPDTAEENSSLNQSSKLVTDFHFATNSHPLRCVVTGKCAYIPILYGTKADKRVTALTCPSNHKLEKYNSYWSNCRNCSKRNCAWICFKCYDYFCNACFDGHKRAQDMERRDPERNPTYLRCQQACSFTLQIPLRGGACVDTGDYTISLELRFVKLPPAGNVQSLLRFSLPDLSQAKRLHRTSVYVNGDGFVVGRLIETGGAVLQSPDTTTPEAPAVPPEQQGDKEANEDVTKGEGECEAVGEEIAEGGGDVSAEEKVGDGNVEQLPIIPKKDTPKAGRLFANKWAVVTVCVQPSRGRLSTYINGSLCSIAEDLDPADLRLQHRIVILGGGKQAHVRGGDIRRVTIHNSSLDDVEVKDLYYILVDRNPAVGGLWPKVQARVRGYLARKKVPVLFAHLIRAQKSENEDENVNKYSSDDNSSQYSSD